MKNKILVLTSSLFLLFSARAMAESDPQMKAMVDNLVNQMKYQLEAKNKLLSDPKIFEALAKQHYMYYQALIKAGFSKDQAMQLVVASEQAPNG